MQQQFIMYLKEQTGIDFKIDPYFSEIKTHRGQKYFNLDLGERVWNSRKYLTLERLSETHKTFTVEPNGIERIAIFLKG